MTRYRKVRLLGKGGMGEVWQVHDQALNCDWAMKLLAETADIHQRQAFALETEILTKLNHPGIPRIVDKLSEPQGVIMDLVSGIPLSQYGKAISETQLIDWGTQLLHILIHIHEQGILYLDCKPDNIMLDENGQLHLVDFGIACWKQNQSQRDLHYGTVGFAPLEQYEAGILDERCDVYAFGKTLISLALGIHHGEHLAQLHGSDTTLSQGLRIILDGCVHEKMRMRYPDMKLLLSDWQRMGNVRQDIKARQKRSKQLLSLCVAIGTICYFLAFSQWFLDQREQAKRFEAAMRDSNYSLAIRLDHNQIEPFVQLYEKTYRDTLKQQKPTDSYMESIQKARYAAIQAVAAHDLNPDICDDDFLYRLARDALLTQDEELLSFAQEMVSHMDQTSLRTLLEQLCQWYKEPLLAVADMEQRYATWMATAKQDDHFIELGLMAAQIYELHSMELSDDGYEHWQLWMEQLDTHRLKQDEGWLSEEYLSLLYRMRADSYYQYGRYLKNRRNYDQAAVMFTKLRELEQAMSKEGLADEQVRYECGNACLYLFQEGEKQMEHLDLLDQAKVYYEAALLLQDDYPQAQRGLKDCQRLLSYWGGAQ